MFKKKAAKKKPSARAKKLDREAASTASLSIQAGSRSAPGFAATSRLCGLDSLICWGGCETQDSGGTHYAYRLFVAKPAWTEVVAELAGETDYDNFKSEVARHHGKAGAAYEHTLHDVWSAMNRLQQ